MKIVIQDGRWKSCIKLNKGKGKAIPVTGRGGP
jgi:hypothetical protein